MVYEDNFLKVRLDNVIRPDGKKTTYSLTNGLDCVFVVPVTHDNKIILVEQERYPVGREVIEIPAGGFTRGEDVMGQAAKELKEEINGTAEQLEELGTLMSAPSRQDVRMHVVVAVGVEVGELGHQNQEGNEAINRVWAVEQTEVLKMIRGGILADAATLASLNLYWAKYGYPKG